MTEPSAAQLLVALRCLRGVKDHCKTCCGVGVITYGSTSTWRGGVGGQAPTQDVCNKCWGSGDRLRPWPSRRAPNVAEALAEFQWADAALSCGSGSCYHRKAGQVVNGPCRCYPHTDDPKRRQHAYAAARLRRALEEAYKEAPDA